MQRQERDVLITDDEGDGEHSAHGNRVLKTRASTDCSG